MKRRFQGGVECTDAPILLECGCWQMDRTVVNQAIKDYQRSNPGKLNVREMRHDVKACQKERNAL